ncbi:MAG: IS110 family transposase, partial [Actinobacteria bacterium]|nr:IS110 family transposase [Actinomycetota bacterium]
IGIDMGDKSHRICLLDDCQVVAMESVANTRHAIRKYFGDIEPCLVAMEAGTHSGWVSRILEELGYEVIVANPRKVRAIWDSVDKNDDRDAEMLARIANLDPELLYPIHHRGAEAHADLAVVKARNIAVKVRSSLISSVKGTVKAMGERISKCSPESFHKKLQEEMPEELRPALEPVRQCIEELTVRIRYYDKLIEQMCEEKYPETKILRQICGVGPVTALAFVLTIEEDDRFVKSRDVGAYFGLVPKRDQSGETDKQLHITKAGNGYMRTLLVGCAQYILGAHGPDCDLKRFGLKLAERGGKNAKRRAVVAVARKLAVLMHRLWVTGAEYDPFYKQNSKLKKTA